MTQPNPASPNCSCTGLADDDHYHLDRIDDCIVVTAGGQVDAEAVPRLLEAIEVATAVADRIVIDLTRVTFLDPTALEALNRALGSLRRSDESVSLVGPAGVVQSVLQGVPPDATVSVPDHIDDTEVALTRL